MKNSFSNRSFRGANSNRSNTPLLGTVALVLSITLLFAVDRFSGGIIHEYARAGIGGIRSIAASAGASITDSGVLSTRNSLARENEELRREIALHAENIAQAEFLKSENEALQEMARLAQEQPGRSARVLTSFDSSPYGTFLIDIGTNDGVHESDIVLSPGGFMLGIVTSASITNATVESLFAPGKTLEASVGEIAFTAEGQGGGNARAQVPREALVTAGMSVIAQMYNRNAGMIMHIESASSSATADLSIRIPVNLDTMRYVYVVTR